MQLASQRQTRPALSTIARSGALALVSVLAVAASGSAQGPMPQAPQQPPVDDSTQAMIQEFQQMQMQLGQLQSQALEQNEELQTRQEEISDMVNAAIIDIDPALEGHMTRLEELQEEATAAQESQNMEELQALVGEAQGLQSELQAAQAQALEQEAVATEIEAFQADLMAAMIEIDPEADQILARLDELAAQLNAAAPGA